MSRIRASVGQMLIPMGNPDCCDHTQSHPCLLLNPNCDFSKFLIEKDTKGITLCASEFNKTQVKSSLDGCAASRAKNLTWITLPRVSLVFFSGLRLSYIQKKPPHSTK